MLPISASNLTGPFRLNNLEFAAHVIEPFRVGASRPDMPAWLDTDLYVNVPL